MAQTSTLRSDNSLEWAGGVTNYAAGPFSMYMKSISVTDYSTGSQYKYSDQSGTWQSIQAVGGKVNGNSGADPPAASSAADPPASSVAAPSVISSVSASNNAPMPFSGTHRDPSSSSVPSVYPWVSGSASTLSGSVPSGWPTTNSGTSVSEHPSSISFPYIAFADCMPLSVGFAKGHLVFVFIQLISHFCI